MLSNHWCNQTVLPTQEHFFFFTAFFFSADNQTFYYGSCYTPSFEPRPSNWGLAAQQSLTEESHLCFVKHVIKKKKKRVDVS